MALLKKSDKEKKPAKEKKPKKEKKPPKEKKEKKSGKKGNEGEEAPAKGKPKLLILILALVVVVVVAVVVVMFVLRPGSKLTAPETYTFGEETVPSIDTFMVEEQATLKEINEPTEEFPDRYTFRYEEVTDVNTLIQTYCEAMTGEEYSFTMTDDTYRQIHEPGFAEPNGEIILVRPAEQEGKLYRIVLGWAEMILPKEDEEETDAEEAAEDAPVISNLTVEIANVEGTIEETEPPSAQPELAPGQESHKTPTLSEQVSHFYSLSPSVLGLEGESMEEYSIFPVEGIMSVDGISCRQMHVYQIQEPEMTNAIVGVYLMTLDLEHIYQLDPFANTVTQLQ